MATKRLRILITGQVQGVGFRPHVYRIAICLNLTGWVENNAAGVLIEVQGKQASIFLSRLLAELPPLAKINDVQEQEILLNQDENIFQIRESRAGEVRTIVSPDTSVCAACLQELFDSKSRYYRYPFLSCSHCGPRLTITHDLPYDRDQTSMAEFVLCVDCNNDYSDSANRRYYAQATACVNCGPQLSLSTAEIVRCILAGEIIAVKGLGGYQIICDARNENAVLKLRAKKQRQAKPFAIMVANIASVRNIAILDKQEENLLQSKERPIVLLRKKNTLLPEAIAPGLSHLGVILPYTPLHYLLFNAFFGSPDGCDWLDESQETVLVVTSANLSGNPLIIDHAVVENELTEIVDKIVWYDRKIVTRVDDSLIRSINDKPFFIRRARGFVPTSIKLPHAIPATLAVGGHLKNTFCITRGDEAFVSQHIGSLNNKASIEFFHESLHYLLKFLHVKPERIAHDLHPDFYTTQFAHQFAENYEIPSFAIQHHHAHLAAVAAERHVQVPALGLALDGYGYGVDGQTWGGELFLLENTDFKRLGFFSPLPQVGGDSVAREPWRMAAGVLHTLERGSEIALRFAEQSQANLLAQILAKSLEIPLTSSCGRLFDAAAALLGINKISQYEGQAAMQLESLVTCPSVLPNGWQIMGEHYNMLPTLAYLSNLVEPVRGANLFHGTLIAGLSEWIFMWAEKLQTQVVLLSGGCFLNKILAEGLLKNLESCGLKPFLPYQLPPNDGGISLGQAWIAGRMAKEV